MPITPDEIEGREFGRARKGYDPDEVARFLVQVAADYRDALAQGSATAGGSGEEEDYGNLGREIAAVLKSAHDTGAVVREEAEAAAAEIRREADVYANSVRSEADLYVVDRRRDADVGREQAEAVLAEARRKAEAELADAQAATGRIADVAEREARSRAMDVIVEANQRIEQARTEEGAARERVAAALADLEAALARLATPDEPDLDLTGSEPVVGLDATPAPAPAPEPVEIPRRPTAVAPDPAPTPTAHRTVSPEPPQPPAAPAPAPVPANDAPPVASSDGSAEEDPLARMVKDAVGRAVESAMRPSNHDHPGADGDRTG